MDSETVYSSPAIQTPSEQTLKEIADKVGLDTTGAELNEYQGLIQNSSYHYTLVDNLPDATPRVKYPRVPGYRPSKEEDPYNAWECKTIIKGAENGPLFGKKIAIKDNILVAGVPMMNGSRMLEGYIPDFDATAVTRVLDAGGTICGKARCEDLCISCVGWTCARGGPTLNPADTTRDPGGSSSGCAALLASGEVDLAIGADQGGSARMPAAWSGIVGLKPTYGLIPYTGVMCIEPTIDHLGPMARNVKDVALLLEVIAGRDDMDFRQPTKIDVTKYSERLAADISSWRIGVVKEGFEKCEGTVGDVVKDALSAFEKSGAKTEEMSLPAHVLAHSLWFVIINNGLYNNMVLNEGSGSGHRSLYPTSLNEHLRRACPLLLNDAAPSVKNSIICNEYIRAKYGNKFYNKALNLIPGVTKEIDKALEKYDVLAMPTMLQTAPKIPTAKQVQQMTVADKVAQINGPLTNTSPYNVTGHPAISLPAGRSKEGMPIGIMLVGKMFEDKKLLQVAYALEQALLDNE